MSGPWGIWLNGGPGSSSLVGLFYENGPIHLSPANGSMIPNNFSWDTLMDMFWIDQPVGTGYSTADDEGYINDEDQMGEDFFGFLSNLVQVFPSLQKRPFYLMGERIYLGTYIPYIVKTYFGLSNPPVKLIKFAIGDGSLGSDALVSSISMVNVLETYPQLIDYDQDVFNYFKEQQHLCGYDLNFTYPQNGHFPPLRDIFSTGNTILRNLRLSLHAPFKSPMKSLLASATTSKEGTQIRTRNSKRDLTGRANGTIDPFYECDLFDELLDYALNFTLPWSNIIKADPNGFGVDVYDIPDALDPAPLNIGDLSLGGGISNFLNDNTVRTALHAPTSKDWAASFSPYPFQNNATNFEKAGSGGTNEQGDPSNPTDFLTQLATNSSQRNVSWVIYSGNDDMLVAHFGSQAAIQNTTFGGIQGFSKPPSTPWFGDDGQMAGIVHQERNVTFVLFKDSGHLVPQYQPERALTFVREFILGSNKNGTVNSDGSIVGGNSTTFVNNVLPGFTNPIFTGSGTTAGSTFWPSATIAAWESFIATAAPTIPASQQTGSGTPTISASQQTGSGGRSGNSASKINGANLVLIILAGVLIGASLV
ncbi:hypothetical protein M422DRAFT_28501 [Sphaerobolus stellatus SS14]|uniref:Carboxypeptidase n=1 Tax=Sphaerobolus stellatus (strain SS14) TaxID=990650 RepID=A0A0C9VW28_SPHS4|nr:hypothetical protein M422DRAFT_28501 [Sphaerobolus stellatus SS14]